MSAASPRTVEDRLAQRRGGLTHFCEVEPVKQHLRLLGYYQLARQMIQQAEAYVEDKAWDEAYVYLARFIKICSKVIPAHRDYKKPWHDEHKQWIRKEADNGTKLFDTIMKGMEENEIELMKEEEAQREAERRRPATPPPPPEPERPNAQPTLEDRLAALRLQKAEDQDRERERAARSVEPRRLRATYTPLSGVRSVESLEPRLTRSTVSYPSVGRTHWMDEASRAKAPPAAPTQAPPPQQRRPVSRQQSQEAINHFSSGQLRTLEIPSGIINDFTVIAAPNTNKRPNGIETCGILAGKLHRNRLIITTLIIPKQRGSSDTCSMTNEEELSNYCFGNDLLTLGWIHTHPRQNCFLSSVDIHTQCAFQSMLPESIAIVVAPTDIRQNVGVFRLTQPGGMELIQQCTLTGFHTHPEHIQIYSAALACEWNSRRRPVIVDMR